MSARCDLHAAWGTPGAVIRVDDLRSVVGPESCVDCRAAEDRAMWRQKLDGESAPRRDVPVLIALWALLEVAAAVGKGRMA